MNFDFDKTFNQRLCQGLSYSVVGLAVIMKIPQILAIIEKKSSAGINLRSLMLEFYCFSVLLCYQYSQGYPLNNFLEFVFLCIQDIILLLMVLGDRKMLNIQNMSIFGIYLALMAAFAQGYYPPLVKSILITCVTPVSFSSKLLQLLSVVKAKDPGNLSATTWAIATYTCLARLTTHILQTGDMALVINSTQAGILSFSILLSIFYYHKKEKQS